MQDYGAIVIPGNLVYASHCEYPNKVLSFPEHSPD